jgi:hypothetical protein
MEASGWLFLLVSMASVLSLTGFCFYKVINLPEHEEEDLHGTLDIDTRDRET